EPIERALAEWCAKHSNEVYNLRPRMPSGIEDRDADCWEPLIAIADVAGGKWPDRARAAALYLTGAARDDALTDGVELLQHIRDAFLNADSIWTTTLIERLCSREESPWLDMGWGKRLTDRVLADRLKSYRVKSRQLKISGVNRQGYLRSDFAGLWKRYLPEKA